MDRSSFPRVYAGIDEAGYGPLLGPLVVARTVILCSGNGAPSGRDGLWGVLRSAVCREVDDPRSRIPVNDSKQVYTPAAGVRHLERTVLSFLGQLGCSPSTVEDLVGAIAFDRPSRSIHQPWYSPDVQTASLPSSISKKVVTVDTRRLGKAMATAGVRLASMQAAIVFEDRFNHLVGEHGTKAESAWRFVAGHLKAVWEEYGDLSPLVVVDRQGGRKRYAGALVELFPDAVVKVVREGYLGSLYSVEQAGRKLFVDVRIGGDANELTAALASMLAKYVRELFMMRLQRFWQAAAPGVKPSAGYSGDGRRFLKEIEAAAARQGIDLNNLVRCR
jgi:hypothetical protein